MECHRSRGSPLLQGCVRATLQPRNPPTRRGCIPTTRAERSRIWICARSPGGWVGVHRRTRGFQTVSAVGSLPGVREGNHKPPLRRLGTPSNAVSLGVRLMRWPATDAVPNRRLQLLKVDAAVLVKANTPDVRHGLSRCPRPVISACETLPPGGQQRVPRCTYNSTASAAGGGQSAIARFILGSAVRRIGQSRPPRTEADANPPRPVLAVLS